MARLLTVPSGWGTAYAPTTGELRTLAAALSGTSAAINQAAESFPVEYPSMDSVLGFVAAGGIYVDYCGWPMYFPAAISAYPAQGQSTLFGSFLSSIGADRYYCDGFDSSGCMPAYPYDRGWLCKYDISSPAGLIYGKGGVQCPASIFGGGDTAYSMVAVRSAGGKGSYFYGAVDQYGAVDPNQFAQFILSFLPSSQGGSGQTLQQKCEASGGVYYENECLTRAEYECIIAGGTWQSGVCKTGGGTVLPKTSINWPLVGGLSLLGLATIAGLVALIAE